MWTRVQLKENAKKVLSKFYWVAFGVCIVAGLLGFEGGNVQPMFNWIRRPFNANGYNIWDDFANGFSHGFSNSNITPSLIRGMAFVGITLLILSFIGMLFVLCLKIFIGNPIVSGKKNFFLQAKADRALFRDMWANFTAGRYAGVVKAMVWRDLFLFLWGLLPLAALPIFIVLIPMSSISNPVFVLLTVLLSCVLFPLLAIPLIIKSLSYMMVPFIISENPGIHYRRALQLSMQMTYGHKWRIFVLGLSFLGWIILGVIACCGLGLLFLDPYLEATSAELYIELRNQAIEKGICPYQELGLIPAEPVAPPV